MQALYHAQDQFTAILEQGATPPVDAFPFLELLPEFVAPWKVRAKNIREEQRSLYFSLLEETKERMREGKAEHCFMAKVLEGQEKNEFDDEHVAYLGGILVRNLHDVTPEILRIFRWKRALILLHRLCYHSSSR